MQVIFSEIRLQYLRTTAAAVGALTRGNAPPGLSPALWPSDLTLVRIGCRQATRAVLKLEKLHAHAPALLHGWDSVQTLHRVHRLVSRIEHDLARALSRGSLRGVRYVRPQRTSWSTFSFIIMLCCSLCLFLLFWQRWAPTSPASHAVRVLSSARSSVVATWHLVHAWYNFQAPRCATGARTPAVCGYGVAGPAQSVHHSWRDSPADICTSSRGSASSTHPEHYCVEPGAVSVAGCSLTCICPEHVVWCLGAPSRAHASVPLTRVLLIRMCVSAECVALCADCGVRGRPCVEEASPSQCSRVQMAVQRRK